MNARLDAPEQFQRQRTAIDDAVGGRRLRDCRGLEIGRASQLREGAAALALHLAESHRRRRVRSHRFEQVIDEPRVVPGIVDRAFAGAAQPRHDRRRKTLLHRFCRIARRQGQRQEVLPRHGSACRRRVVELGFDDRDEDGFRLRDGGRPSP